MYIDSHYLLNALRIKHNS